DYTSACYLRKSRKRFVTFCQPCATPARYVSPTSDNLSSSACRGRRAAGRCVAGPQTVWAANATPEGWGASREEGRMSMNVGRMTAGRFTLRAGITLALCSLLGLGLFHAGTARAADNAFVRVVHAATADEHVDVFVNNGAQPQLTGFTFSNVT